MLPLLLIVIRDAIMFHVMTAYVTCFRFLTYKSKHLESSTVYDMTGIFLAFDLEFSPGIPSLSTLTRAFISDVVFLFSC